MAAAAASLSPAVPPAAPPAVPARSFVFINDTNPDEAKSKAKRKLVRAQAARGPHANTLSSKDEKALPTLTKHQALKRGKKDRSAATTFSLSLVGLDDLDTKKDGGVVVQVEDKGIEEDETSPDEPATDLSTPSKKPDSNSSRESPSSNSTLVSVPKMPGTGWAFPFIPHPDPERPYVPMLINHYLFNLAVNIPELDAGFPYILRAKWFPMVITSPATLYIVLLTSASHFACFVSPTLSPTSNRSTRLTLLSLKQRTLSAINSLIRAHGGADCPMPDTVIGAVAKMASYEAMFGSPEAYHTHMKGLLGMIEKRGGIEKLGLDGLLERMVMWIDINSAFLLNSKAYLLPTRPLAGQTGFLQPNPTHFLGAS